MKDKFVGDIMVPVEEYPCIPDTLTIGDAVVEMTVQILRTKHLSLPRVALVFDEDFKDLRGVLRRRDIMRGLEPRFLITGSLGYRDKLFNVDIDPNLSELSYDKITAGLRNRAKRLVGDFMIPIRAGYEPAAGAQGRERHRGRALSRCAGRDCPYHLIREC
ncbi:MAG: CBS domain-containing protein [Planctomycetota bacterium]|jgi:hypothetical protein